jgi:hypothetical protein
MLLRAALPTLLLAGLPLQAQAQEEATEENDVSFALAVTTDTFFGFAPMAMGGVSLSDTLDFTFYGIYWSGGTGAAWGNWTEFGAGVNINLDGIGINPQLGIVSGNLLSGGASRGAPAVFGDGIVPNLTINLAKGSVEGQIYAGYYAPLRSSENPATGEDFGQTAYIHYWANAGYRASDFFSVGAHYEHLWGGATGDGNDVYQWVGPYVHFHMPDDRVGFRFNAGTDLVEGNDSFYKMSMIINF